MIKLTDLLNEEETYTAINKDSGAVSVFLKSPIPRAVV